MSEKVTPSGTCWCGCGGRCGPTSFFQPGHDSIAQAAVLKTEYGDVASFLAAHGYGLGAKSARDAGKEKTT